MIVVDNGAEFTGKHLDALAYRYGVKLHLIRPGKPVENCFVESFNDKFCDECLNEHWFTDLQDARNKNEALEDRLQPRRAAQLVGQHGAERVRCDLGSPGASGSLQ